jgi:hypothetical protein
MQYKYVQSHNIILGQHVSVTPVTNVRVSCEKNIISLKLWYKMNDKTTWCYIWFYAALLIVIKVKLHYL